jgi:hypothetical protein
MLRLDFRKAKEGLVPFDQGTRPHIKSTGNHGTIKTRSCSLVLSTMPLMDLMAFELKEQHSVPQSIEGDIVGEHASLVPTEMKQLSMD